MLEPGPLFHFLPWVVHAFLTGLGYKEPCHLYSAGPLFRAAYLSVLGGSPPGLSGLEEGAQC